MALKQDLKNISAYALRQMICEGKVSCEEVVEYFLERIRHENPKLHAFLFVDEEGARAEALAVDALVAKGEVSKPLLGIPMIVPDTFNIKGFPTTHGSRLFADQVAEQDDPLISQLKSAGAVILGKGNVAEFGLYHETTNRLGEACCNPYNLEYSPGGPSGGVAAALAAELGLLAMTRDVNGSLRVSASYCGLTGILPTRGRVPVVCDHQLPYSELTFCRRGIIGKNARDVAMALNVMGVPNARDEACCPVVPEDYLATLSEDLPTLKIAWNSNYDILPVEDEVFHHTKEVAEALAGLGHDVREHPFGANPDYFPHFMNIFSVDRYVLIMQMLQKNPEAYGQLTDYTKDFLKIADQVTGIQYSLANTYVNWLRKRVETLFHGYDLLLLPATPSAPFRHGQAPTEINGKPLHPQLGQWSFAIPFNMTGHPVITIPAGTTKDGLPIGVQLVGRYWTEGMLLNLANKLKK